MSDPAPPPRSKVLLAIHWIIILNFAFEIGYVFYMVFFVMRPEGAPPGPLGMLALKTDPTLMMARRAYATEGWIAISGLSLYLALTEITPRFWRR